MQTWKLRSIRRGRWAAIAFIAVLGLVFAMVWNMSGRSFLAHREVLGGDGFGYKYFVVGNSADVVTSTRPGFVLQGGGTDIDESFAWMIERSGGGDFLVIRTTGTDAYNDYLFDMIAPKGLRADSVATLIVTSREGSFDPFVAQKIRSAEALWIAGGNQALHHAWWRDSPVADAIHDLASRGVPIGGTSSGLAVMGEYTYTSEGDAPDDVHFSSSQALRDPGHARVTIRGDFLHLPFLDGTILEPHFIQESRYGRMAVFLSRIAAEGQVREPRGIGIDRRTALLVESDGSARVITGPNHPHGRAILFRLPTRSEPWKSDQASVAPVIEAQEFGPGSHVDLRQWQGCGGTKLRISIDGHGLKSETRKN